MLFRSHAVFRTSSGERITAKVVDMSQGGLGLELSAAVPIGTRVFVDFAAGTAFGELRHCSPAALIFRAGMRIDEFVVRKQPAADPSASGARNRAAASQRVAAVSRSLAFRIVCSCVGHDYRWSDDAWSRPVLRCTRCHQDLDASTH